MLKFQWTDYHHIFLQNHALLSFVSNKKVMLLCLLCIIIHALMLHKILACIHMHMYVYTHSCIDILAYTSMTWYTDAIIMINTWLGNSHPPFDFFYNVCILLPCSHGHLMLCNNMTPHMIVSCNRLIVINFILVISSMLFFYKNIIAQESCSCSLLMSFPPLFMHIFQ